MATGFAARWFFLRRDSRRVEIVHFAIDVAHRCALGLSLDRLELEQDPDQQEGDKSEAGAHGFTSFNRLAMASNVPSLVAMKLQPSLRMSVSRPHSSHRPRM